MKLAQGAANVTVRDNNGVFEIKQSFKPERIAVCIKSAEVAIESARGTAPANVALKSVEETALPKIRRVGRN